MTPSGRGWAEVTPSLSNVVLNARRCSWRHVTVTPGVSAPSPMGSLTPLTQRSQSCGLSLVLLFWLLLVFWRPSPESWVTTTHHRIRLQPWLLTSPQQEGDEARSPDCADTPKTPGGTQQLPVHVLPRHRCQSHQSLGSRYSTGLRGPKHLITGISQSSGSGGLSQRGVIQAVGVNLSDKWMFLMTQI